jgi:3-isopropylmalate/(R)-2-methylmalate dehydratase large subunit
MTARTMAEKIWDDHAIGDDLMFIDLHLVHEVSSPQAFEGLRAAGRTVRRVDRTLATADHNVPTTELSRPIADAVSRAQLDALSANVKEFGVPFYGLGHARQGIGPELGLTQPGMTRRRARRTRRHERGRASAAAALTGRLADVRAL